MNFIRIRFNDSDTETDALGFLPGRFTFRSWENGETLAPTVGRLIESATNEKLWRVVSYALLDKYSFDSRWSA